jgi:hypothetical protein
MEYKYIYDEIILVTKYEKLQTFFKLGFFLLVEIVCGEWN